VNYIQLFQEGLSSLLSQIPVILVWVTGIVLGAIMLRRGGGRAEKLFLTGCSLALAWVVLPPFFQLLAVWLSEEYGISRVVVMGYVFSLPIAIIGVSAVVCLGLAFWWRWRRHIIMRSEADSGSQC